MSMIARVPHITGTVVIFMTLGLSACGDKETTNVTNNAIDEEPVAWVEPLVNCNGVISLDATASYDPDGKPLTYRWTMLESPSDSELGTVFSNITNSKVSVLADKNGDYRFRLVVSDGTKQAVSIQTFRVSLPNYSISNTQASQVVQSNPYTGAVPILCKNPIEFASNVRNVILNAPTEKTTIIDGALVTNTDKDLSYQWRVLKSPTDSQFNLANDKTSALSFTAQNSGDYTLAVEVKKAGQAFAAAVVNVRASEFKTYALAGEPTQVDFLANTQKLASIGQDNLFRVEDLANKTSKAISLEGKPRAFAVSPDGTRVVVVLNEKLSVLDLNNMAVIKTWPIKPAFTIQELKMVNNKVVYFSIDPSAPNLSQISGIGLFDSNSGEFKEVKDLEGNIVSFQNKNTFLDALPNELVVATTYNFYYAFNQVVKAQLNSDGLIIKSKTFNFNDCDVNRIAIADKALLSCGDFYQIKEDNSGIDFISKLILSVYPQTPSITQYKTSADRKFIYGVTSFSMINNPITDALDIVKIGVDSKKDEAKLNLPMVLADDFMKYPTVKKMLSSSSVPLAVLTSVPLKNGKNAYYVMTL